jgi:acetyl-CoA carboxylase biotin carboxyl carrier protein
MDLDQIKALTELMVENDLTELMLRDGETRVVLRRNKPGSGAVITAVQQPMPAMVAAPQPAMAPAAAPASAAEPGPSIKSPMVGTFYASSSPDSSPFVTAGSRVEPDTVVCIIEAMKVFNEIKAEVSGTIERVLVTNGQPVEYGQPLFLVK